MSRAFLDLFENMSPGPDGIIIKLHPGLKKKLQENADHLDL